MNDSKSSPASTIAPAAAWPRPTLTELPALRDLTLQSGVAAAALQGSSGTSSGFSFLP